MIKARDKAEWLENPISILFIELLTKKLHGFKSDLNELIINCPIDELHDKINILIELKGSINVLEDILDIKEFLDIEELEDE